MNGQLRLRAGVRNGRTILLESTGTYPLQVLRAHSSAGLEGVLSVVVLQLSGGLLDGDAACIEVVVESGARLALRTQAATQVHAGRSRHRLHGSVGDDAWLSYVPHALVPHAHADYYSQTVVKMQPSSRVLLAEALAPGRVRFGEQFAFDRVRLDVDVWCGDARVARERSLVRPDPRLQAAQFGAALHTASVYMLGAGEPAIDATASGTALIDRSPLARGGWYVRAASNRASELDDVLQRLHAGWVLGTG